MGRPRGPTPAGRPENLGSTDVALAALPPTGATVCAQVRSAFRTTIALPSVEPPTEVVVDGQEAGVVDR